VRAKEDKKLTQMNPFFTNSFILKNDALLGGTSKEAVLKPEIEIRILHDECFMFVLFALHFVGILQHISCILYKESDQR